MRERRREEERRRVSDGPRIKDNIQHVRRMQKAHMPRTCRRGEGKALALCLLNNILGSTSELDTGRARNPSRGSASVIARLLTFAASAYQQKSSALN